MANKTVLIGLDGVPYKLVSDLVSRGTLPNIGNIVNRGFLKKMESSIPEVSNVAWSSIITGKNPGEHGIYGFTEIPLSTYRLSFPNFNNLKAVPFWEQDRKKRSAIINVPSTFPVREMNGIHIAGFVALDLERAVFPPSLIPRLREMEYRIDVDVAKAEVSMDLFLEDLFKTLEARIGVYRNLWKQEEWDTFMFVFTGTDRISHFLWDAYENDDHKYHHDFLNFFSNIDAAVGEIAGQLSEDDLLVLMSDHGFEALQKDVNVNFLLKQSGFLYLEGDSRAGLKDLDQKTAAFALDPGRIYINLEQKFPRGSVNMNDYDRILTDIEESFRNLDWEGKKVIKKIFRKNEIFQGPYMSSAPDLVLMPNSGFNLKAGINPSSQFESSRFTGKHSQGDAFLLVDGQIDEELPHEDLKIQNILKIVRNLQNKKGRRHNA